MQTPLLGKFDGGDVMKNYLKIMPVIIFIAIGMPIPAQAIDTAASPAPAPTAAAPAAATPPATAPVTPPTTPVAAASPAIPPVPAYYNYANNEAEYSLILPEAPMVRTIWGESSDTKPYIENLPTDNASVGEVATFKRVDIDTEEEFDVKITFLKARRGFLLDLTKDKVKAILDKLYTQTPLTNEKFSYSPGTNTLRWATLSGFMLDSHNHPAFSAAHYLTGLQSILVIQTTYSIENKLFDEYYNILVNSITYSPP